MASVINAYSVSLGLDASAFIDGAKVSRSEMRQLTRDIEAAQTPFEKYAVEQDRLKRALDSGAISQGTYNRLLQAKKPAVESLIDPMLAYKTAIGAVAGGITAATAAGVAFVAFLRSQQNAIDDTADAAQRLGLSFNEMTSLEFAFREGGGVGAEALQASLKKLQINMAKAVDGDTTLRESFSRLGLDAGQLIGQGPQKAILSIADKMQGVATHAERLKIAMELFGKSGADLASSLADGSDSLQAAIDFQQQWNSLTDKQVAMVGANNDAWDRLSIVAGGLSNKLAAEAAPAMLLLAEHALGMADSFESVDTFLKNAVTSAVILAGMSKDMAEYFASVGSGVITGGMVELGDRNFDTALTWYKELEAKRRQFAESGKDAAMRREQQRQTLLMQDVEDKNKSIDNNKDLRAQERAELESQRQAELANRDRKLQEEKKLELRNESPQARGVGTSQAADFIAQWQNGQANAEAKRHAELIAKQNAQLEATRETNRKLDEIATVQPRNRR